MITNKAVPSRLREGLNVESGLNDGLCVPFLLLFIALETGSKAGLRSGIAIVNQVLDKLTWHVLAFA